MNYFLYDLVKRRMPYDSLAAARCCMLKRERPGCITDAAGTVLQWHPLAESKTTQAKLRERIGSAGPLETEPTRKPVLSPIGLDPGEPPDDADDDEVAPEPPANDDDSNDDDSNVSELQESDMDPSALCTEPGCDRPRAKQLRSTRADLATLCATHKQRVWSRENMAKRTPAKHVEHLVKSKPVTKQPDTRQVLEHALDCVAVIEKLGGLSRAKQLLEVLSANR